MTITLNEKSFFVFDLDDTLYLEIDYLKSAYRHIAGMLKPYIGEDIYEEMWNGYVKKENVFTSVIDKYQPSIPHITAQHLLHEYRTHPPQISLADDIKHFLQKLKNANVPIGLITDGRGVTQRNKLKALNISDLFSDLIISEEFGSEKPDKKNYLYFEEKYPDREFYFIGDNTKKDFVVPAEIGWHMICIKNSGQNIHNQDVESLPPSAYQVSSFSEIALI